MKYLSLNYETIKNRQSKTINYSMNMINEINATEKQCEILNILFRIFGKTAGVNLPKTNRTDPQIGDTVFL